MKLSEIAAIIQGIKARSAWKKGVLTYAIEILERVTEWRDDELEEISHKELNKILLNGASDWGEYSWGGCSLIYNSDICARLAPPSIQRKKDSGRLYPNRTEHWLDTQARALYQAAELIWDCVNENISDY